MKIKLFNIFLYLVFVLLWGAILSVLTFMRIFDTFLDRFSNGALLTVFAFISVTGIIITILCRKKMKYKWMLPLFLIISTIITTAVNYGVLQLSFDYISVYTREKWDNYPLVRYRMLDSLNEQHEFIGMNVQEVKEILGEPARTIERDERTIYQYIIGDDFIDPYTYDFIVKNGIVVETSYSQL